MKSQIHILLSAFPALFCSLCLARQASWPLALPVWGKDLPKTFPKFCWSSPHFRPRQLPNHLTKLRFHLTLYNKSCSQLPRGPTGSCANEEPLVLVPQGLIQGVTCIYTLEKEHYFCYCNVLLKARLNSGDGASNTLAVSKHFVCAIIF